MRRFFAACAFALGLLLVTGCETELESPGEITLQTRNAADVLPAGVRLVGMVDLQAVKRNALLRDRGGFSIGRMSGEMDAQLDDFIAATGFDPEEDLREVYVALQGEGAHARPLFVAYADFARDRLQAYFEDELDGTFTRADYKGVPVFQSPHDRGGEAITIALANNNMLVASPAPAEVHAMLDRLSGEGRALKDNEATMRLIRQAGAGGAWFVARGLDREPFASVHDRSAGEMAQLSRAVQDVAFSLDVEQDGIGGDVWMVAASDVSPGDLASLTRGAVAALKAGAGLDSEQMAVLDDVRVREADGDVRVSFRLPNAMLGKID